MGTRQASSLDTLTLSLKEEEEGGRGRKKYILLVASQTHFLTYFTYNLEQLILVWEFRIHISRILPILLLWQGTVSATSS